MQRVTKECTSCERNCKIEYSEKTEYTAYPTPKCLFPEKDAPNFVICKSKNAEEDKA